MEFAPGGSLTAFITQKFRECRCARGACFLVKRDSALRLMHAHSGQRMLCVSVGSVQNIRQVPGVGVTVFDTIPCIPCPVAVHRGVGLLMQEDEARYLFRQITHAVNYCHR